MALLNLEKLYQRSVLCQMPHIFSRVFSVEFAGSFTISDDEAFFYHWIERRNMRFYAAGCAID